MFHCSRSILTDWSAGVVEWRSDGLAAHDSHAPLLEHSISLARLVPNSLRTPTVWIRSAICQEAAHGSEY